MVCKKLKATLSLIIYCPCTNTNEQTTLNIIVFKASLDTVNTYWKGPLPVVGGNKVESVKDCCACVAL